MGRGIGTDTATRVYIVGTQVFRSAAEAAAFAYEARHSEILAYRRPDKKPFNKNWIPLIPALQKGYLLQHLEHIATYRQNGTSTLYFARFKCEGMPDGISF